MFIRRGNAAAFEVLVSRYQSRLLAFCRHLLGSREDAEDVLQEVFSAAFHAMLADERPINVRPWLYRIARNRSLNHLRRIQAVGVDSMDVHFSDNGASTADKVHDREEFRMLMGDIQQLPETQRTALVLREMDALSYEQIAEAMETTVPSVKSLLVRARVSLAEASEARLLSCEQVRIELGEVAEGLQRKPGPLVRRHLKGCQRCSIFSDQLKETNKALAALMPIGPLVLLKKLLIGHVGHSAGASAGAGSGASGAGTAGTGAAVGSTAAAGSTTAAAGSTTAAAGGAMASGAGGVITAGVGAIATKAAAGLAAAALVTAGAVEVSQPARHRRLDAAVPSSTFATETAVPSMPPRAHHHVAARPHHSAPPPPTAKQPTTATTVNAVQNAAPTAKPPTKNKNKNNGSKLAKTQQPEHSVAAGRTQSQHDSTVLPSAAAIPGSAPPATDATAPIPVTTTTQPTTSTSPSSATPPPTDTTTSPSTTTTTDSTTTTSGGDQSSTGGAPVTQSTTTSPATTSTAASPTS
jgi:RNA polymerase sigma factor (sigma-70 family)